MLLFVVVKAFARSVLFVVTSLTGIEQRTTLSSRSLNWQPFRSQHCCGDSASRTEVLSSYLIVRSNNLRTFNTMTFNWKPFPSNSCGNTNASGGRKSTLLNFRSCRRHYSKSASDGVYMDLDAQYVGCLTNVSVNLGSRGTAMIYAGLPCVR